MVGWRFGLGRSSENESYNRIAMRTVNCSEFSPRFHFDTLAESFIVFVIRFAVGSGFHLLSFKIVRNTHGF